MVSAVCCCRSGALALEEATLHVVLAATHAFDKGLVDTVVQVAADSCSNSTSRIPFSPLLFLPSRSKFLRQSQRPITLAAPLNSSSLCLALTVQLAQ